MKTKTRTPMEIMQHNGSLNIRYGKVFHERFKLALHDFMDCLTGFDLVKFDQALHTPDGTSTRDWIKQRYGEYEVKMIERLIEKGV